MELALTLDGSGSFHDFHGDALAGGREGGAVDGAKPALAESMRERERGGGFTQLRERKSSELRRSLSPTGSFSLLIEGRGSTTEREFPVKNNNENDERENSGAGDGNGRDKVRRESPVRR